MSDHKGAVLLFSSLPKAKVLLGDKGYDSDWFRAALASRGTAACILHPAQGQPQGPIPLRQGALPPAPQGRKHVRQDQGLAPRRNPLRPLCPHLHVRHLHRRNRLLLVVINES